MDGAVQRNPEAGVAIKPVDVQEVPQGFAKKLLGRFRFRGKQEVPQIEKSLPIPEVRQATQTPAEIGEIESGETIQELAVVREALGVEPTLQPHPEFDIPELQGLGEAEINPSVRSETELFTLSEVQGQVPQQGEADEADRKGREQREFGLLPEISAEDLPNGFGFSSSDEAMAACDRYAGKTVFETLRNMIVVHPDLHAIAVGSYDSIRGTKRSGYTIGEFSDQTDDSRFPQFGSGVIASMSVKSLAALAEEQVVTIKLDKSTPGQELVVMPNLSDPDAAAQFRNNLTVKRLPKEGSARRQIAKEISAKAILPQAT